MQEKANLEHARTEFIFLGQKWWRLHASVTTG